MKLSTLPLLFIFLFSSCNSEESKSNWPENEKEAFMTECTSNADSQPGIDAEDYCSCMLDKVMKEYPTPEDALKIDMEWMMEKAQECL
jgi:hypothetical protein